MRSFGKLSLIVLTVMMLSLSFVSVSAQDAPTVRILPVNGANFLPGSLFDFRVEVHAEALPEDFAVTINGTDASEVSGLEPVEETWTFGPEDNPTPVVSWIWRGVTAPAPGEYLVEVIAGGQTHTANWVVREAQAGTAKNVILFIADGGSAAVYTAARLVSRGMTQGTYDDALSFDKFEEIGLVHTSGLDSIITDSANSASAYNTGHKTAVNATGTYPDSSPNTLDDPRVETFGQMIKRVRGMSVGIVTTSDWTDATPAAVFAAGRNRSGFNRSNYAIQALDLMPEVILGGGGQFMLAAGTEGSRRPEGDTADPYALYEEAGYVFAFDKDELNAALAENPERLLGIFHSSDMNVWLDRNVYTDNASRFPNQPGLVEMTMAAIDVLDNNPNGFYLQVEAASVDKQLHPMDMERGIADTIEFDRAIAAAWAWAQENAPDTLIVVTSDHAHSFDVFGTVNVEVFNAASDDIGRRNAIGIYNGAGFPTYEDQDGDFYPDSWEVSRTLAWGKVEFPDFTENYQVSPVPRTPAIDTEDGLTVDNPDDDPNGITLTGNLPMGASSSVHTLQDVPVYAQGPGSEHFGRVIENVEIFFGMAAAIGLDPSVEGGMAE